MILKKLRRKKEEEEFSYEEHGRGRLVRVKLHDHEVIALGLPGRVYEGYGAAFQTYPVGAGIQSERDTQTKWLVFVSDPSHIVKPYEGWAKEAGQAIANASGSYVENLSILAPSGTVLGSGDYDTITVDNEYDLNRAYADGYIYDQFIPPNTYILKRPK